MEPLLFSRIGSEGQVWLELWRGSCGVGLSRAGLGLLVAARSLLRSSVYQHSHSATNANANTTTPASTRTNTNPGRSTRRGSPNYISLPMP
jgi:hypothetical protein